MVGTTRDLRRNFTEAAWAIRKHLDFVSTFTFHARTDDEDVNNIVETFIEAVSDPLSFDLAGRHGRQRFVRLLEAGAVVDGDCAAAFISDGRVQGVEGDRIRTPMDLDPSFTGKKIIHGVQVNDAGRAIQYLVCRRAQLGVGFEFERAIPARYMNVHGYFDRFDQVRGVTPLATAINQFQDVYEGRVYALAKAKVAQLFGLIFTREQSDPVTADLRNLVNQQGQSGNEVQSQDYIDQVQQAYAQAGIPMLDMDKGDDAKFLENRTPSTEFQSFDQLIIASALKSLDIPFSFYDESHTNFFGSKNALQQYLFSVDIKRANLMAWLNRWAAWRLGLAIATAELILPKRKGFSDLSWEWVPQGLPWWKPLEEVKAQAESVKAGFTSTPRVCKERGDDAYAIMDEEKRYRIALAAAKKEVRDEGGFWPDEDINAKGDPELSTSAALADETKGDN